MRKGYEVFYRVRKKVFLTKSQYKDIDKLELRKEIARIEGVEEKDIRFVLDDDRNLFRKV